MGSRTPNQLSHSTDHIIDVENINPVFLKSLDVTQVSQYSHSIVQKPANHFKWSPPILPPHTLSTGYCRLIGFSTPWSLADI